MKKQAHQQCPVPTGKLILIGGAENKSRNKVKESTSKLVLEEFVKLCGIDPVTEVVTTAGSESPEETFTEYSRCFKTLGAKQVIHINHEERSGELDALSERVSKANGIFFTGGDQLKLTAVYGGTQFMTLLKQQYIYHDLVIGGTSAGAMAMSTPMIFDGSGPKEMVAAGVKITKGFEFLKDSVSTHTLCIGDALSAWRR